MGTSVIRCKSLLINRQLVKLCTTGPGYPGTTTGTSSTWPRKPATTVTQAEADFEIGIQFSGNSKEFPPEYAQYEPVGGLGMPAAAYPEAYSTA
eukprot:562648-Rhodomonas_salina.1